MADDSELQADEWDPPQLNRHLPFPPPLLIDLDVVFSFPLVALWVYGLLYFRGYHLALPSYFLQGMLGISAIWALLMLVTIQRRRLAFWLPVVWSYFVLAARAAQLGRQSSEQSNPDVKGHGWLSFVLPPDQGHARLANVHMHEDGTLELSAGERDGRLLRFLKWLLAIALAREPLIALLKVSRGGPLDLLDPEARAGVWALRQVLVQRPEHSMSLYLRVSEFPLEQLLRAAGQAGTERSPDLLEWAQTLVLRRLLLAVPAGTRRVLARRLLELVGLPDQPGKLGQAGMAAARLSVDEIRELREQSWGADQRPTIGVSPNKLEIDTGQDDPTALSSAGDVESEDERAPGVRRFRTYSIMGLPQVVRVGWMEPLTGRRIHCQVGWHIRPVRDSWAESVLGLKRVWWRMLPFGGDKYRDSAWHARRTLDLIRRRETSALKVGLHVTVPESQVRMTELALKEMVGRGNYLVRSLQPLEARMATEPTGRDPMGDHWWTDSQTVAMAWPGMGGMFLDGCLLLGDCPRSQEPIGWHPWWDETTLGVICGRPGSGKTNLEQKIAASCIRPHPDHWLARRPPPVIVVYLKPYDEWEPFCDYFDGRHYHMAADEARGVDWRWALEDAPLDAPVVAFNIVDLPDVEQVAFMTELEHWVEAHQKPHNFTEPLLYIIGEAWAWAQDPAMAKHLRKYALQVRAMDIALLCDTQRPKHLLGTIGEDLIETASMVCLMRMKTSERRVVADMMNLGEVAVRELAQIDRPNTLEEATPVMKGRGIIEVHGVTTLLQVRRFGFERKLLDQTNPRLRDVTLGRRYPRPGSQPLFEQIDRDPDIDKDLEEAWAARKNGRHAGEPQLESTP